MSCLEINVHYVIRSNGDGSASVIFCNTAKEAEILDVFYQEVLGDGWGESEYFTNKLKFDDHLNLINGFDVEVEMQEALDERSVGRTDKAKIEQLLNQLKIQQQC